MMSEPFFLTALVVIVALAFDFVNGFHDASNSIATIVATRVLKPKHAVMWASFFNFVALFLFGTGVAKTVGSGMIDLQTVTPVVILAGLIGAIGWGLATWWFGIPTSSSHALLGGYAGAAMANSALHHGWDALYDPIIATGWAKTFLFIVIAPALGMVISFMLMKGTIILKKNFPKGEDKRFFGGMQLLSSALLSLMHGTNDAQKTAGIIAGALAAGGFYKQFTVPYSVLLLSYAMMGIGTFFGGWRIVDTMGRRLTRLQSQRRVLRRDRRGSFNPRRDAYGSAGLDHACDDGRTSSAPVRRAAYAACVGALRRALPGRGFSPSPPPD